MMMAARHDDNARRAANVRAAHVMAAMHAAMAHAVTGRGLGGDGNGSEDRRGGGESQSKIFHGIPWESVAQVRAHDKQWSAQTFRR